MYAIDFMSLAYLEGVKKGRNLVKMAKIDIYVKGSNHEGPVLLNTGGLANVASLAGKRINKILCN